MFGCSVFGFPEARSELIDRNPQTLVDIYSAKASDFRKATHRVYRTPEQASSVTVQVLP